MMLIELSLWRSYPAVISYETSSGIGVINSSLTVEQRKSIKCAGLAKRTSSGVVAVYAVDGLLYFQYKSISCDLNAPGITMKWQRIFPGLFNRFILQVGDKTIYKTIYPSAFMKPGIYLQLALFWLIDFDEEIEDYFLNIYNIWNGNRQNWLITLIKGI